MITKKNAEALFSVDEVSDIIQGVIKESAVLKMFTQLPNMTSGAMRMRVLDGLPMAYWVGSTNNGRKNLTEMAWANKYIIPEELAVIVPIKEDVLDDASIDIWAQVRPRLVEAIGKKIDQAILVGVDKPAGFRADLLTSILNAGAYVAQGSGTLYSAINDAMVKVEESGYNPTGIIGGVDVKGKFRMMLDTSGQPIKGTEIDELPKAYIDNGAWDKTKAQMIVGDFTQAVYSIRQDITYKLLTEAVIQDPSDGTIKYNLAQEDMVALRVVMRLGWEIPNPINALQPDESVRFPFAAIQAASALTTQNVTFTVTNNGSTGYVKDAVVTMGGLKAKTNASGQAVLKAQNNTSFTYKVKADGYQTAVGTVDVAAAAKSVAVTLKKDDGTVEAGGVGG